MHWEATCFDTRSIEENASDCCPPTLAWNWLEADDVEIPSAASPPVHRLAIISGFSCTAAACGHLCASSKRLRRHWSESHGVKDPPFACGRSVNLQTFFRGTKLRYFEVASVDGTVVTKKSDGLAAQQRPAEPAVELEFSTEPTRFQLLSFMKTIQCCADSILALYSAAHNVNITRPASSQAKCLGNSFDAASPSDAAPALVKRLQSLPYRMAEVLEKPDRGRGLHYRTCCH